jgi:hypothetical protein
MKPRRRAARRFARGRGGGTLGSYRDAVTELMDAGESFGEIEDAIDDVVGLTLNQKAALWLFAFSLRDQEAQQLDARAHLAAVE